MFGKKSKFETVCVFGVNNDLVSSYVERKDVDEEFNRALTLKKHIIVFGSSKQGKTSLFHKHLKQKDYIKVECTPDQEKENIYKSILRQLNVEILAESKSESGTSAGASIKSKIQLGLPMFGGDVSSQVDGKKLIQSVKYPFFKTLFLRYI